MGPYCHVVTVLRGGEPGLCSASVIVGCYQIIPTKDMWARRSPGTHGYSYTYLNYKDINIALYVGYWQSNKISEKQIKGQAKQNKNKAQKRKKSRNRNELQHYY